MPRQKSVILLTINPQDEKLTPNRKNELNEALEELDRQLETEREAHEKELAKIAAQKQIITDRLKGKHK